jgi:predicted hotdog family 3-hydroxylacyl-ACP dehydratase
MPEALLEVMAQCFAAGAGLQAASAGQEISWGYLAAVRDMWVHATVFSGDTLHAEAKHRMSVGPLHIVTAASCATGLP